MLADVSDSFTEEQKKKKKKRAMFLFGTVGAALVLGIVFLVVFSYYIMNRSYSGYDIVSEKERADSNNVTYLPFNHNLLKYSRDGISALDESGETLWNGGYEMEQPMVDIRGDIVTVADIGAKHFYVYNGKDQGKDMEMTLPIGKVKAAANGKVAVLLHDETSDVIHVYDPYRSAEPLEVEIPTNVGDDGYPLDFDLSDDGESLVVAYMAVQGGTMENRVCFYNFTDVGQDQNTLVGGKSYETSMISRIEFVTGDEVVIFYENGFSVFENMKKPEMVIDKTFEEDIKSADFDDENIMVITGTAGDTEHQTVHLFTFRGKEELTKEISYKYDRVLMADEEIIFMGQQNCYILRKNGSQKFSFDFGKSYDYFFPASRDNQYYYLDETSIQLVRISG